MKDNKWLKVCVGSIAGWQTERSEGRKWSRIEAAIYVMFTLHHAMKLRSGRVQA